MSQTSKQKVLIVATLAFYMVLQCIQWLRRYFKSQKPHQSLSVELRKAILRLLKQIFEVHKVASVVRGGSVNKTLVFPRIRWYTVTFLNLAVGRLNPRNHWSAL